MSLASVRITAPRSNAVCAPSFRTGARAAPVASRPSASRRVMFMAGILPNQTAAGGVLPGDAMSAHADRLVGTFVAVDRTLEREFEARLTESATLAFRVAYGVLRHTQDAEDVAQEAFVRAHRRFAQLRDRERFRAWLVRITWRLALDRRRGDRRRAVREEKSIAPGDRPDPRSHAQPRRRAGPDRARAGESPVERHRRAPRKAARHHCPGEHRRPRRGQGGPVAGNSGRHRQVAIVSRASETEGEPGMAADQREEMTDARTRPRSAGAAGGRSVAGIRPTRTRTYCRGARSCIMVVAAPGRRWCGRSRGRPRDCVGAGPSRSASLD